MSVAKELSEFRAASGVSLREVGSRANLSYARLSEIENEKIPLTFETLVKICRALEVPHEREQDWLKRLREQILLAG